MLALGVYLEMGLLLNLTSPPSHAHQQDPMSTMQMLSSTSKVLGATEDHWHRSFKQADLPGAQTDLLYQTDKDRLWGWASINWSLLLSNRQKIYLDMSFYKGNNQIRQVGTLP